MTVCVLAASRLPARSTARYSIVYVPGLVNWNSRTNGSVPPVFASRVTPAPSLPSAGSVLLTA